MTAPRPLAYWLRTLDTLLEDEFARAAEEAGLSRGQWQVLSRLRVGGIADDVVEEGLAPFVADDESVSSVLDRVEKDGLVTHSANEYRLTDRGQERLEQVEDGALGDLHGRALDGVSQEEHDALLASLERVATNLGWRPA